MLHFWCARGCVSRQILFRFVLTPLYSVFQLVAVLRQHEFECEEDIDEDDWGTADVHVPAEQDADGGGGTHNGDADHDVGGDCDGCGHTAAEEAMIRRATSATVSVAVSPLASAPESVRAPVPANFNAASASSVVSASVFVAHADVCIPAVNTTEATHLLTAPVCAVATTAGVTATCARADLATGNRDDVPAGCSLVLTARPVADEAARRATLPGTPCVPNATAGSATRRLSNRRSVSQAPVSVLQPLAATNAVDSGRTHAAALRRTSTTSDGAPTGTGCVVKKY